MAQAGRPMSELRGRTEEANALATWLRKVTAGVQVRVLAETFPYSKSVWSEYRNGAKLIPEQLLNDVVDTLVSDMEMRDRQRTEGLRLLQAAQKAVRPPTARPAPQAPPGMPDRAASMPAGVGEVLLRLDDARLQQIEAMRKLADSEKRCTQLQEMVSVLQNQCAQLTEERDHARLEAHGAHELQAALEQSEKYREQAEGQLRHARKATEQAFELRLAAEANVARVQADARRTTGAAHGAGAGCRSRRGSVWTCRLSSGSARCSRRCRTSSPSRTRGSMNCARTSASAGSASSQTPRPRR